MGQPPVLPNPPQTPPETGGQSMRTCVIVAVVAAGLVFLIGCSGVLAAIMLPAFMRAREAAVRASCQGNLKQFGLIFKMYANEQPNELYPPLSSVPGRLMFEAESVYPEYLSDPTVLVCPSDDVDYQDWQANGVVFKFFDDHSYFYLGHLVQDEDELLALIEAYRAAVDAGDDVSGDLVTPDGQVFPRLSENLSLTPQEQSQIPVMFDATPAIERGWGGGFQHVPGGANVLYMDGHVDFIKYPAKWPMTERVLMALDSINK
jgi:prepilin-type processing-associated H-X9-DG protein